jgi:NIPSNAP
MKNKFKSIRLLTGTMCMLLIFSFQTTKVIAEYYQIKIYHFKTTAQEDRLDSYFKNAFIPAMHKAGVSDIGIFKTIDQDTDRRIFVFIPIKNLEEMEKTEQKLQSDPAYAENGKDYINASFNDYPYLRIETVVVHLFSSSPKPILPVLSAPKMDRVYELRSYENPSEKAGISKTKMFESGELSLFDSLEFHAVFYGKVIAGNRMPNLMYMTTFNSKADRDAHWELFKNAPAWKAMVAAPEYQHNLNNATIWLLHPAAYSDF